ncbi:MAG: carbon-nitrogen hydrolase family protein [Clostridiales Family XIII bacterium]|jgi:predicted amidohydrolase|nr:carbon-nitrogen hydrolase family protein [Clostridiales Family XIII bacterium]
MDRKYKIALCQMLVSNDKDENREKAARLVNEAAAAGAKVVCLPEIWNSPYDVKKFAGYEEPSDGPSVRLMSGLARENGIFLIGGSIPERGEGGMYNTSFVFDPSGAVIARHRKVHLFDVDIEGGIHFKESDFFAAGDALTTFDTDFGTMGLAICFDVRFPEMFRQMTRAGAHIIFLPASFNMTTGPVHWDLLMRSRALDNQIFFAACSPARDLSASYHSWGHSCIATPWGDYCGAADQRETIVYGVVDRDYQDKIRQEIPLGKH